MPAHRVLRTVLLALAATAAAGSLPEARPQQGPASPAGGQVRDSSGGRGGPPRTGTATMSGTVTVMPTGQPAAGARVMLMGPGLPGGRGVMTDDQGRFSFPSLPAGRYLVTASKQGYVNISYGQRRTGGAGTSIPLRDGETRELALQLPRGGVITGMVLDERGDPALNVMVRAMSFSNAMGQRRLQSTGGASTDDRGIYRIHSLQPGDYAVCATHRHQGQPSESQRIQMQIDSLRRTVVSPVVPDPAAAQRQIAERIRELEARLRSEQEPAMGYAPVCFPGVPSPSTAVQIAAGEERAGVDFQLHPTPVARVEGTLVGVPAEHLQGIQVTLVNADDHMAELDNHYSGTDPEGRFRFSNIPEGSYTLLARTMPGRSMQFRPMMFPGIAGAVISGGPASPAPAASETPVLWAEAEVLVSGEDILGVALDMHRGMSLSGHVVFQGTTRQPPEDLSQARISMFAAVPGRPGIQMGGNAQGEVDSRGRFTINDILPSTYTFSALLPGSPGWFLESVMIDGQNALDHPLEVRPGQSITGAVVTFTDQQTELSGTIVNGQGEAATEHMLLLYAADERYRRPRSRRVLVTRANPDGGFLFRAVPPGDYRLTAVLDPEPGAWFDPEYLQQLDATSLRVTLRAGEKIAETLRVR